MQAQYADEEPITIPDGEGGFFESLGYKVLGEEAAPAAPSPASEAPEIVVEDKGDDDLIGAPEIDLSKLTIPQLQEYAKANEIDLTGADLKADILARVLKEK